MRRIVIMIVLAIATLCVAGTRSKAAAQAIVHDPTHMAGNAVGFTESLREAFNSTAQLVSLLDKAGASLEFMKKADKYVQDAYYTAITAKKIYDCLHVIHDIAMDVNSSIKQLKYAYSNSYLSHQEATKWLGIYTQSINQVTAYTNQLISVTTNGIEIMSFADREKKIERYTDSVTKVCNKIKQWQKGWNDRLDWRSRLNKNASDASDVSDAKSLQDKNSEDMQKIALMTMCLDGEFFDPDALCKDEVALPTAYVVGEVNNIFRLLAKDAKKNKGTSTSNVGKGTGSSNLWGMNQSSNSNKKYTSTVAKNDYTDNFKGLGNVFYAISAIVGLLGAVQVYRKYQIGGEDITKSIAIWSFGTLTIFILGLMFGF